MIRYNAAFVGFPKTIRSYADIIGFFYMLPDF